MALLLKLSNKFWLFVHKRKPIKLKASTLIETLVATVLIVTIFSIASLALNTIFKSTVQRQIDQAVDTRLYELKYLYVHGKITSAHQETVNNWTISMSTKTSDNQSIVLIKAVDATTNKTIVKQFINDTIE